MKIQQLLEQHRLFSTAESLTTNFGDGYLLKHNRIYRSIRQEAVKAGYTFVPTQNDFYQALPMTQLENLLSRKEIPSIDNVTVLETLTKLSIHWEDLAGSLKKNHVFHEACHAVARAESQKFLQIESETTPTKTLRILLEESFANTCELLAMIDVENKTHQIFFETNSYTFLPEEHHHLKTAAHEMGFPGFFKFMVLAYLQSNFLQMNLEDRKFDQAVKLATGNSPSLGPKQLKSLKALAKIAFTLDFQFKNETTKLHLRLCGVSADPSQMDALEMFSKEPRFQEDLESLVARALG